MTAQANTPAPGQSADAGFIGAFKRYGGLMIITPSIVVILVVGYMVTTLVVRDLGRVFASGMNGTIGEAYDQDNFKYDPTTPEYAHFSEMVAQRIASGRLTALRVQDSSGRVVYSTKKEELGTFVPLDDTSATVLESAGVESELTVSESSLAGTDGAYLSVVGPVELHGDRGVQGIVTIIKPLDEILPSLKSALFAVVITVLLGAVATYTLLRLLVLRAERQLRDSHLAADAISRRLGSSLNELERTYLGTLQAFNAAVDAKDHYTGLHSLHVADYACALGIRLEMDDVIGSLERAGLLHDIGKIGVPEAILQKPAGLTDDEYAAVREHSAIGARMIETVPFLADIMPAVRSHHERWDGAGYPDGLVAEQTPVLARILAIADAFDAMTTTRPYRQPMTVAAACAELMRCRGTQFDPQLTDVFIELVDDGVIVLGVTH